ncbi:hypothetical protein CLIB1423_06S05930 [[Candida] railenensis]|uniref:Ferric reductase NAD binding domain-containing protein n=1 Tax=[Candida] railenensis TaxID=45579 RepID=A0A9P0QPB2_9ASCO|nr:hypothetical protein CLIB1423_06S05930 [[Candida] railenensis]
MPMKGLTRKLYEELDETIATKKKVFLDGPYGGSSRDPLSFDNLTMISTGSGVTATLPFLQFAVRSIVKHKELSEYIVLKDIHFVWIIRSEETIEWVREELDRAIQAAAEYVTIDIYIVNAQDKAIESIGDRGKHEVISEITEKGSETSSTNIDTVPLMTKSINIHHEKPNISQIMEESRRYLKRKNMIVSCGSTSMRREVCRSVAGLQSMVFNSDIHKSQHTIEEVFLHTEAFGW